MRHSLLNDTPTLVISIILFVMMVTFTGLGFLTGKKILTKDPEEGKITSILEGSVFALLGLLLAFTFGMSSSRFDVRRKLQVEEANHIGTAILRADLYPDSIRRSLHQAFKSYLEARIGYFNDQRNDSAVEASEKMAANAGSRLWQIVTYASKTGSLTVAPFHMVPALNNVFDIANSTKLANQAKAPESIIYMLPLSSIVSSFFAGYSMRKRKKPDWLVATCYAFVISLVIFIIIDLDRPSRGLIKIEIGYKNLTKIKSSLQ